MSLEMWLPWVERARVEHLCPLCGVAVSAAHTPRLLRRARSLRGLSDGQLLLWDAAAYPSVERAELDALDCLVEQLRLLGRAVAPELGPSCPICLEYHCSRTAEEEVDGARAPSEEEAVYHILRGPCYHVVCQPCAERQAQRIARAASGGPPADGDLQAELRRVTEASLVPCPVCNQPTQWPWRSIGPYSRRAERAASGPPEQLMEQ